MERSTFTVDRRDLHIRGRSDDEWITGIHPVMESIAAGEPINRIMIGNQRRNDAAIKPIVAAAAAAGISVAFEADDAFGRFRNDRHQHVAALAKRFAYTPWGDVRAAVREAPNALVVVLDHVEDPQNVGAVLRNADGAGATAVVIPDRRGASVTPAARRAAAGAASHVRVSSVPNLARCLADLKADGCWIYGLTTAGGSEPYTHMDYNGKTAIVVGSEGKGLSRLIAERCDRLVSIPLAGKVSSLNASSAAAIVLFEALRQRTQREIVTPKNKPPSPVNP